MKHKLYFLLAIAVTVSLATISFGAKSRRDCKMITTSYPGGGATGYGAGLTGASWDNGGTTCNACHSGGSYNPTTTLTLLSGTTPVTQYTPGVSYSLQMKITAASGSPKYAFCMMSAKTTLHTNINTWGTCPAGSANHTVTSRNYIEQTSARTATGTTPASYYTYTIPWTGPAAGSGNITFFAEGMAVNGTGGTDGDSPATPVTLSVTENTVLPVNFVDVNAVTSKNGVTVSWKIENELNIDSYEIENSTDGSTFYNIGSVVSQKNTLSKNYQFTQIHPESGTNYYRITARGINNTTTYSKTISISLAPINEVSISPNPAKQYLNIIGQNINGLAYTINGLDGNSMKKGIIDGNSISLINIPPGDYFITIRNKNKKIRTLKFVKL